MAGCFYGRLADSHAHRLYAEINLKLPLKMAYIAKIHENNFFLPMSNLTNPFYNVS